MWRRNQAAWREAHPGYFIAWRAKARGERNASDPVDPPRVPPPLTQLPWELAQEEFGVVPPVTSVPNGASLATRLKYLPTDDDPFLTSEAPVEPRMATAAPEDGAGAQRAPTRCSVSWSLNPALSNNGRDHPTQFSRHAFC